MNVVGDLSASLGVSFGTSGVRGLVSSLTPKLCYAFTCGFVKSVANGAPQVAVGMDLRPSSPDIVKTVLMAIRDCGVEAVFCGALPTPALAFYAMQNSMPSIMITGSHIPFDRNGIKFYRKDGEISKADEVAIMQAKLAAPASLTETMRLPELSAVNPAANTLFISRYLSLFPQTILIGKRIGVYEHSSVARELLKHVLIELGADVISLERTETFVPIDTEAVSDADKEKGLVWSAEYQLDMIVSTDGDGDRPLIGDEKGHWLRGDVVGILCAEYLQATHVVTPVNSNTALEASSAGFITLRTRIGSPYVIAGMESLLEEAPNAKVVGYEANGGFLVGSTCSINNVALAPLPTRDSVLPILILLVSAVQKSLPLSQLTAHLPARFTASDRIKGFATDKSSTLITDLFISKEKQAQLCALFSEGVDVIKINHTDGVRMTLSNKDVVHLRSSGNSPELRCYAESSSVAQAETIVTEVLRFIGSAI